jgi:hypothetical protein
MPEGMKNGKAGAFQTIVDACGCYPKIEMYHAF